MNGQFLEPISVGALATCALVNVLDPSAEKKEKRHVNSASSQGRIVFLYLEGIIGILWRADFGLAIYNHIVARRGQPKSRNWPCIIYYVNKWNWYFNYFFADHCLVDI